MGTAFSGVPPDWNPTPIGAGNAESKRVFLRAESDVAGAFSRGNFVAFMIERGPSGISDSRKIYRALK
jgi:hypothetical protein